MADQFAPNHRLCPGCNGTGRARWNQPFWPGECPDCKGKGVTFKDTPPTPAPVQQQHVSVDELMEAVKRYGEECGALVMQMSGEQMDPPASRREAWDAVRACAERLFKQRSVADLAGAALDRMLDGFIKDVTGREALREEFMEALAEEAAQVQQQSSKESDCNWWCPHCKCAVPPSDVTYEETHDSRFGGCGQKVTPVQQQRAKGGNVCNPSPYRASDCDSGHRQVQQQRKEGGNG